MIEGKRIVNSQGLEIVLVTSFDSIEVNQLVLINCLILDYSEPEAALQLLRQVRSSMIEPIFLLPIFIFSINGKLPSVVSGLVDGVLNTLESEAIVPVVLRLQSRKNQLESNQSSLFANKILTKVLRYIYTRDCELNASIDVASHMGYSYPICEAHFQNNSKKEMFALLEQGKELDYLYADYVDTLHPCPECSSAHLNIREVCPKCSSGNISSENLIHHFVCANMAPESAYLQPDGLVCPKCSRRLRHIGVDYDKPSFVYTCVVCTHQFQQPDMKALCFSCQQASDVEYLPVLHVYNYQSTTLGKEIALVGVTKGEEERDHIPSGFVAFSTFSTFLNYELKKIQAGVNNSETQLAAIELRLAVEIKQTGQHITKLYDDIGEFIKNSGSEIDIMSFANNNMYYILAPNCNASLVKDRLFSIRDAINRLLYSTFKVENKWSLTLRMENLDMQSDLNSLIGNLRLIE